MQAPDPVEVVLARLMPPALRQDCQNELEAMIDELAGPEVIPDNASKGWLVRCVIGGGIAAAIGERRVERVELVARISANGDATAQPGDFESAPVRVDTGPDATAALMIDHVIE